MIKKKRFRQLTLLKTHAITVGAGSAGATLAARLSEDKDVSVLLLEAGGSPEGNVLISIPFMFGLLQNGMNDWAYRTVKQTHSSFALNNHVRNS